MMNHRLQFLLVLATGLACLAGCRTTQPASPANDVGGGVNSVEQTHEPWVEGSVQVRAIKGQATYSKAGRTNALQERMKFSAPVVFQAAEGSHVDLYLRVNGPVLRLEGSGVLEVIHLTYRETTSDVTTMTRLQLHAGTLAGVTRRQTPGSLYEVVFASGVARTEGGYWVLESGERVLVFSGMVVVTPRNNSGGPVRVAPNRVWESPEGRLRRTSRQERERYAPKVIKQESPLEQHRRLHTDRPGRVFF